MYPTISINTAESAWNNILDDWQDWSDRTFNNQYRAALLTLVEGLATLLGYLLGFVCCWLALQLTKTAHYWLSEAVQAVPVLNGWWKALSVEIKAIQYPEYCWQAISSAVGQAMLDDEISWAWAAEVLG